MFDLIKFFQLSPILNVYEANAERRRGRSGMIFERKVFYDRKEVKKLQFRKKLKKKQFESKSIKLRSSKLP